MKTLLCIFLFYLNISPALGQRFTMKLDAPGTHIAYPGLYNTLSVTVEKHSCNDIILATDNGEIKRSDGCYFNWIPDTIGRSRIIIKLKSVKGTRTIGEEWYVVSAIPRQPASLSGRTGGPIRESVFKAQYGLSETLGIYNVNGSLPVDHFSVIVMRKDEVIFVSNNKGAAFAKRVKHFLQNEVMAGDLVLFFNIVSRGPDKLQAVPPMQFEIIRD